PPSAVAGASPDASTPTQPPTTHPPHPERHPAKKGKLLLLGGIAGAVALIIVLIIALGGRKGTPPQAKAPSSPSSPSPSSSSPPKPGTRHPEPSSPAVPRQEKNAALCLQYARQCVGKKSWSQAQGYLDQLKAKYGATKFAAANRAAIASVQAQVTAALEAKAPPPKKQPPPKTKVTLTAPVKPTPPPDDDERWTEWEALFDGKTLNGWKGQAGGWRVGPDGVLAWTKGCGHLWTEQQFAGFELALEFKLAKGANSGVFVRTANPRDPVKTGLEVQLVDSYGQPGLDTRNTCGAIYGLLAPSANPVRKPGQWNRLLVRCEGNTLRVTLNGSQVINADLRSGRKPMRPAGHIVLQDHGSPGWFRAIRLRRLKPTLPPPDDDERWTEWEDLFDGKTLSGWKVIAGGTYAQHGEVSVDDGAILLRKGSPATGVAHTRELPERDYEVEVEAMRVAGERDFCSILFRVGDSRCMWVTGGGDDGNLSGLWSVDGAPGDKNDTGRRLGIAQGRWLRLRLRVEVGRIRAWVDGEKAVDILTSHRTFALPQRAPNAPFALSAVKTTARIRSIRLRRLKPVPWKVYTKWPFDAAEAKRRQSETAKALGVPVEQEIDLGNGVKMTMVLIPAGEFLMGSPEKPSIDELVKTYGGKAEYYARERPQHRVRISKPFWLGKTEVTQAQCQAVMSTNPSKFQAPENPVEQVNWNDCQTFLTRLNEKIAKKGFRLPSEAEWEYACRAGTATQFHFGNANEALSDYAWWTGNSESRPHPVRSGKPNCWSLHDMTGNVWEWCQDGDGNYGEGAQIDPTGPTGAGKRVLRGGSWSADASRCRSAYRSFYTPDNRFNYIGFRVSRRVEFHELHQPEPRAQAAGTDPRLAEALKPMEAKVAAWDFAGAAAELEKLDAKEFGERLAVKKDEITRLAKLKAALIARVKTATPKLTKRALLLKGIGGNITTADEKGITAKLPNGKTESFAWRDLSARSVQELLRRS
ncbi:DUF1080 domain-containing protein, partial [bacterium]|nr:DUF1080 domain-containing protein [bacterium]